MIDRRWQRCHQLRLFTTLRSLAAMLSLGEDGGRGKFELLTLRCRIAVRCSCSRSARPYAVIGERPKNPHLLCIDRQFDQPIADVRFGKTPKMTMDTNR